MVHLEHAAVACRAMVCSIRLLGLAFLTEANIARGLDRKGGKIRVVRSLVCWQMGIAMPGGGR